MTYSSLTFKPATASQRQLIHQWLAQDYIREWIHGAGLQSTLAGLEKFIHAQTKGEGLDRQTKLTQHWIGYDGDKPFVYLLTTNVFKDEKNEYAKYATQNGLAITLDIFIGDAAYLGKGLATTLIKEFLLTHFADVAEIFIDPEKTNFKAVHIYQRVGFRIVGEFIAPWHPVPHYVMKIKMQDLAL